MRAETFIFRIYVLWTAQQMLLHFTAKICISSTVKLPIYPYLIQSYFTVATIIGCYSSWFFIYMLWHQRVSVQPSAMRSSPVHCCLSPLLLLHSWFQDFVSLTVWSLLLMPYLNVFLKQLIPIFYDTLCPLAWVIPLSPSSYSPDLFVEDNHISPFHLHVTVL